MVRLTRIWLQRTGLEACMCIAYYFGAVCTSHVWNSDFVFSIFIQGNHAFCAARHLEHRCTGSRGCGHYSLECTVDLRGTEHDPLFGLICRRS